MRRLSNHAEFQRIGSRRPDSATLSSLHAQPIYASGNDEHGDITTGSRKAETPDNHFLGKDAKYRADVQSESKPQNPEKAARTITAKLQGLKRERSDIFKSFSQPKLKTDRSAKISPRPACEVGDAQSVRGREDFLATPTNSRCNRKFLVVRKKVCNFARNSANIS